MLVGSNWYSRDWSAQGYSDRPSDSRYADSRDSTSARSSGSWEQTWSRYVLRSANGRSKTEPTISLTLCHCWSFSMAASLHLPRQPGFRDIPVTFHRSSGNTKHFADLFDRQAAEETHLHNAALPFVDVGELTDGIVERDQVRAPFLRCNQGRSEINSEIGAALGGGAGAGIIHQNLPHQA